MSSSAAEYRIVGPTDSGVRGFFAEQLFHGFHGVSSSLVGWPVDQPVVVLWRLPVRCTVCGYFAAVCVLGVVRIGQ
jgi:hypothetical protein